MEPRLIRLSDVPARPWRNGGGVARDLLVRPADASAWQCQVSVADVERDGPFSHYQGVERWFAVVHGAGVELAIDGRRERLTRESAPLRFSGAAATSCTLLDGPTRDLNLMLRHGALGRLQRAVDGVPWRPGSARCGLFAAAGGRCHADARQIDVPADSLLWFDAEAPAALVFSTGRPPAAAWWLAVMLAGEAAP